MLGRASLFIRFLTGLFSDYQLVCEFEVIFKYFKFCKCVYLKLSSFLTNYAILENLVIHDIDNQEILLKVHLLISHQILKQFYEYSDYMKVVNCIFE